MFGYHPIVSRVKRRLNEQQPVDAVARARFKWRLKYKVLA